jgi:hypothetical protein
MAKRIGKMDCPCCGSSNDIYQEDLGFEEFECGRCENTFTIPEDPEDFDKASRENRTELAAHDKASHFRIMAQGEDGHEWCIKNMVDASMDEDLIALIVRGCERDYPEARIWTEDEESTSAGYRRSLMFDVPENDC